MHPGTPLLAPFASWTIVDWANHLWQSTVVAAAILILLAFCGKLSARTRLALGWIALGKFALPLAALVTVEQFLWTAPARWLSPTTPSPLTPAPLVSLGDPTHSVTTAPASSLSISLPASPAFAAFAVRLWLAGFVVLLGGWCIRALRARRRLMVGARVPVPNVQTEIVAAARLAGLKTIPRCVAVDSERGPALMGFFSPVVIVPRGLEERLTSAEFRAVLLHEFFHLRQRDHVSGVLRAIYTGLLWFDPVVWLLNRRLATEMEKACDERVIALTGDPETYASGIVKTVRHSLGLHEPGFAGVTTPPIVSRIQNILAERPSHAKRWPHLVAIAVALSLAGWSGRVGFFVIPATAAESAVSSPSPTASQDLAVRYLSEQRDRVQADEGKARAATQSYIDLHAGEKSEALEQRTAEAATTRAVIGQRLKEVQERGTSASAVASSGQSAPIYVLRAGDLIRVQVFQREDLNQLGTVRLSAESAVVLPLIGKIDLQNKTLAQTQDLLRDRFVGTGVENARVAVSVLEYASRSSEQKTAKEMTLSVDFPDEEIRNVLRNVADLFELKLVMPATLRGKTTVKLNNVTWRQIFHAVLDPIGYTFVEEGATVRITEIAKPAAALNANDKSYTGVTTVNNGTLLIRANNDKIAVADETSMRTEVFLLKFARPSVARLELSSLIQSPAGKLADDERANALVVTESPAILAKIRAAVQQLDHP